MTDRETTRLIVWSSELRRVHQRLRDAVRVTQEALSSGGDVEHVGRDLLLYCHGFCAALDGHHRGEDRALFPALEEARPDLTPVLRALEQDHSMISHLLTELRAALDGTVSTEELDRHLGGIAAIMESHFRYEEQQLLTVLEGLELDAAVTDMLGPL
ncbi:hemerythrin domain-containing protein [Leifsonia sp. NPDC014704]|uniref:hemerythrin domain-containing protein n=1 Tax=Leifsonia sp. NPDC014704 TaxID=3364123 RepID=UPI0036F4A0C2